jgi:hypothetical protein
MSSLTMLTRKSTVESIDSINTTGVFETELRHVHMATSMRLSRLSRIQFNCLAILSLCCFENSANVTKHARLRDLL